MDSVKTGGWTCTSVYVMAAICVVLGIAAGYFVRGSAAPAPVKVSSAPAKPAPPAAPAATPQTAQITREQMKQMAEKQAAPLLEKLKTSPNDPDLLANIGNIYSDTQQFKLAVEYYGRSLQAAPSNANVRTDMGTVYFYLGDPDRAIREFETALRYDPKHAQTLFNLGMVKWQAKSDTKGAVECWERLLRAVPDYPDRAKVQELISRAKQHARG